MGNTIKIKLKKLHPNAALPIKARCDDFCYDVVAVSEEEVAPNVWCYGLGFAYEFDWPDLKSSVKDTIDPDFYRPVDESVSSGEYKNLINISIDFRPRSSVWKTGMILSNCVGTLDEGYRGEVKAVFYHVMPNMPRYKVGDRIGQIKIGFTVPVEFEFVDEIDMNTDRGQGGFGSTGK